MKCLLLLTFIFAPTLTMYRPCPRPQIAMQHATSMKLGGINRNKNPEKFLLSRIKANQHRFYSALPKKEHDTVPMTQITQWTNVAPFAGYIIAYKTNSTDGREYSLKDSDPTLKFGRISPVAFRWQGGELGYNMARLIKKVAVPSVYALTDTVIKALPPLLMRLANNNELETVHQAISYTEEAKFAYENNKKYIESWLEKTKISETQKKECDVQKLQFLKEQVKGARVSQVRCFADYLRTALAQDRCKRECEGYRCTCQDRIDIALREIAEADERLEDCKETLKNFKRSL